MNILALTCAELAQEMQRRYGKGMYHAAALYREIFKHGSFSPAQGPAFQRSVELARKVQKDMHFPTCRIVARQDEGVLKFATELCDGARVESVIIPGPRRTTLCVSSQVGCGMGCRFCATGAMGFTRNLSTDEIVWQVLAARFELRYQIDNIVFMGMGEPLDNFDNIMQTVRVISDQRGLDISQSHITISTAGHIEGLARLASTPGQKLGLAVSLNAADDELRNTLMPINRRYPLAALKEALLSFPLGKDGIFFIEYVLLAGVNDTRAHAQALAGYLAGLPVRVNLLAYNGTKALPFTAPAPEALQRFGAWLVEEKLFVRVRASRGQEILAACGQLGAELPDRQACS